MKSIILSFSLLIVVSSCLKSHKMIDRESDRIEAEKIADELLIYLTNQNYEMALLLFDEEFYTVTSRAELTKFFEFSDTKLGIFQSKRLTDWNTEVSDGDIVFSNYKLIYKTVYQKGSAVEAITLRKNSDGVIKILGYDITPDKETLLLDEKKK